MTNRLDYKNTVQLLFLNTHILTVNKGQVVVKVINSKHKMLISKLNILKWRKKGVEDEIKWCL